MAQHSLNSWVIGVIGGSGLYQLEGLQGSSWQTIDTPWGKPSDSIWSGRLGQSELLFLPRHGRKHSIPPSDVNYRANIDALKRAGCTDIISISACGSLQTRYAPGDFVIPDQYIDRTFARQKSFFGTGCVAHVPMAKPVCSRLASLLAEAAEAADANTHRNGVYLAIEGPQFSSRAESELYRSWGCDIIGMTNMPEAKLAREAELPYASLCMVTDYDCWRTPRADVSIPDILQILRDNSDRAQKLIQHLLLSLPQKRSSSPDGIETVLDTAIITAPQNRDTKLLRQLDAVAGRVLGQG